MIPKIERRRLASSKLITGTVSQGGCWWEQIHLHWHSQQKKGWNVPSTTATSRWMSDEVHSGVRKGIR